MFGPAGILIALIVLTMALALFFFFRPPVAAGAGEKILAFIGLFILPALCLGGGFSAHIEHSKMTHSCVSCHAMQPFGRSLYVDDPNYIPAAHFQNHRIPPETACYACHADYTFYGPLKDKLVGLERVYIQYVSGPPKHITFKGRYSNGQCLRCHAGARNFEGNPIHQAIRSALASNQTSCISSGCHDTVHNVAALDHLKFWRPGP